VAIAAVLIAGLASPRCPVYNVDPRGMVKGEMDEHGVADERSFYYHATGLMNAGPGRTMPMHEWIDAAREAAAGGKRVAVVENIGFFGYYAGPGVHVVDELALADPVLARMRPETGDGWRVGHLRRRLPAGYVETIESGRNVIEDRAAAELYERMRVITRGDLWDARRWWAILGFP
jgi:arabinofuranosyltransferase